MFKRLCRAVAVVGIALLLPAIADAQEKGQFGVILGYPGSVGVIWHVSDRIAVRPDFTFNENTTDLISTTTITFGSERQTMVTTSSNTSTTIGFDVSGLFYFWKADGISAFVSPRYSYSRGTTTPSSPQTASSVTLNSNGGSGSFGAQYMPGRHFNVFGEVGVAYNHGSISTVLPENIVTSPISSRIETTNHSVGIRSAAGVTFYF